MRILLFILLTSIWAKAQLPNDCTQVVMGISKNWNSSDASITLYEKKGDQWVIAIKTWPARLGKNGLAWGRGLHPRIKSSGPTKVEGDWRAPAGIFKIGGAYGYAAEIEHHPQLPYRQITPKDLWVEDSSSPHYNQHMILKDLPDTVWQRKAQMRQNDHAHSLKLYIGHNDAILGGKPIPERGSAIFFHIWREAGDRPTAGCTTMSEKMLHKLIARIDPKQKPVYVLLPESEYEHLKKSWRLP